MEFPLRFYPRKSCFGLPFSSSLGFIIIYYWFCSTLEFSIDEIKLLTSLPFSMSNSTRLGLLVEIVLCIDNGPSCSRPRIAEALGLGKDRLTLRFSLLRML